MGLCLDFGAIFESHTDVILVVNGDVIHHPQPVSFPEKTAKALTFLNIDKARRLEMKLSFSRKSDKMNLYINCLGDIKMAICYDRLFHLMIDKKISNAQLKEKAGFSANIITRLKRNEYVSIESIEKICRVMECGVDDILEFVPEKNKQEF